MQKWWKSLSFAFVAVLVIFLTACGDSGSSSDPTLPEESELDSSSSEKPKSSSSEEKFSSSEEIESSSEEESSSSENPDSSSAKSSSSEESSNSEESSSSEKHSSSEESSSAIDDSEYNPGNNTLKDLRDGNVYATTTIEIIDEERGINYSQVWMAENLNYNYQQSTKTLDSSSFCFNNDPAYCSQYGRLYLWSAAMDSAGVWSKNGKGCGLGNTCTPVDPVRGVCPKGWHLPNTDEVKALIVAVDGDITKYDSQNKAGKKLKSKAIYNSKETPYGWKKYETWLGNGTDDYSFTALPAGRRQNDRYGNPNSQYSNINTVAEFWSTPEYTGDNTHTKEKAYKFVMTNEDAEAHTDYADKDNSFPVRCVMD